MFRQIHSEQTSAWRRAIPPIVSKTKLHPVQNWSALPFPRASMSFGQSVSRNTESWPEFFEPLSIRDSRQFGPGGEASIQTSQIPGILALHIRD